MTSLRPGAASDVGRVREINEDRYLVAERVYAVADGVGGHQAGEVASQTAVDTLAASFVSPTVESLVAAIEEANRAIWQLAQEASDKRGMGTTMTAAALVDSDDPEVPEQLAIANVGDSRAYLFQQGELTQVSEDHSLVEELVREGRLTHEEAAVHPHRSIITRALGMDPEIVVDSWTLDPIPGDRLLLCSDGLTNELSDERIAATLRQVRDPEEAARDLVRQARAHGGNDNITVVVLDVVDDDDPAHGAGADPSATTAGRAWEAGPAASTALGVEPGPGAGPGAGPGGNAGRAGRSDGRSDGRRVTWRAVAFVATVLAILVGGLGSVAWYARSAYFVGVADADTVVVYKGRPGGLWWFEPTLEEPTGLTLADIPLADHGDLRAGKEMSSLAAVRRYLDNATEEAERQASVTSIPATTTTIDSTTPTSTTTTTLAPPP